MRTLARALYQGVGVMRIGRNSNNKALVELALIAGGVLLGIVIAVQSIGMTLAGI
jgi:hypothetical protein